ncbi:MAG: hypothetical protein ABI675_29545 [Chitinophagaceae bacterium]
MNTLAKILNRSIAGPFYRQHAGAFLFLFFLLFGIQPSFNDALRTHYAFITGILTSLNFFFIALSCWIFYAVKTFLFFLSCLQKEAYDFLYDLNALQPRKKFMLLLKLNIVLLAPVLCYGVFIAGVAIKDRHFFSGLVVVLVILILHLLAAFATYLLIQKAKFLQQVIRKNVLLPLPKTLFGFVLKFVFRRQFITLLIVKFLSFGCLYFFVRTEASVFEERMLWMLYLTSLIGHSILVYKNFHFMEGELSFYRNLPVSGFSTLLSLFCVYVVLLLPEAWALRALITNRGNASEYLWMLLTGPSFLLLLHSLLYTEDMKMEEFLKLLFGVWLVFVFFSLSRNHWLLPAICFVFSPVIFLISYYKYEKNTEIEGLE